MKYLSGAIAALFASALAEDYAYDFTKDGQVDKLEGKRFSIKVGDTIEFVFNENKSTGYEILHNLKGSKYGEIISDEVVTEAAEEGIVGNGGQRHLIWKATGSGDFWFKFQAGRSWEVSENWAGEDQTYDCDGCDAVHIKQTAYPVLGEMTVLSIP